MADETQGLASGTARICLFVPECVALGTDYGGSPCARKKIFPAMPAVPEGRTARGQAGTNADAAERAREDLLRRVHPHSVEAEQAVLSGVFLRPDLLHEIIDQVSDADFYLPAHRMIFAAFKALYAKGVSVDQVTVFDWLRDHDQLEAVGGAVYLAELSRAVVSGANAAHWAKIVRDKSMQRALIDASAEIIGNCYDACQGCGPAAG